MIATRYATDDDEECNSCGKKSEVVLWVTKDLVASHSLFLCEECRRDLLGRLMPAVDTPKRKR